MVGGNSVFIFAPLTLKDGESSKIMLWDKKKCAYNKCDYKSIKKGLSILRWK